ncbi:hypothetical protein VTO73DRAFT_2062 [Trametes versicolor]
MLKAARHSRFGQLGSSVFHLGCVPGHLGCNPVRGDRRGAAPHMVATRTRPGQYINEGTAGRASVTGARGVS